MKVTSVPLCAGVPPCPMTVATICAVPLTGTTALFDTTVMTDWVGASNGTFSQDPTHTMAHRHDTSVATCRRARVRTRGNIAIKGLGRNRCAILVPSHSIGMQIPRQQMAPSRRADPGYAMAGLLVAIAVMGVTLSMVMPTWRTWATREKEAELVFRGEQYMRAVELYQRRFPGAFPTDIEQLIDQRFLRKAFTDPMTGGEFQILTQAALAATPIQAPSETGTRGVTPADQNTRAGSSPSPFTQAAAGMNQGAGGGGIIGVVSSSTATSMALRDGRNRYNEWLFVYLPQAAQPGLAPGVPGQGGGVPGQAGAPQPGLGGAFGGFGNVTSQPGGGARARGGQGSRRESLRPGVGTPPAAGPGVGSRQPDGPGVSTGRPPRR